MSSSSSTKLPAGGASSPAPFFSSLFPSSSKNTPNYNPLLELSSSQPRFESPIEPPIEDSKIQKSELEILSCLLHRREICPDNKVPSTISRKLKKSHRLLLELDSTFN